MKENTMKVAGAIEGEWPVGYRAINVANGAIKHIPNIHMNESDRNRLVAEAKFFRAFNYFFLVKAFGALPFYTEPYESMDNLYLDRTPVETIYALIESDLQDAVNTLPAVKYTENG